MKNSFRSYGVYDALLDEIWSVIEAFDNGANRPANIPQSTGNKRKADDDDDETSFVNKKLTTAQVVDEVEERFNWLELIRKECQKSENRQCSVEKLIKKVNY